MTQPPGQAARPGFPSLAFPRRRPLPPPSRSDSAGPGALARYVSLRVFVFASDWALCSPVSLTGSTVCGSWCLFAPAYLLILSPLCACVWRVPVIIPVYMTLRGCLLSVCLVGSCLSLLSGSASASLW